MFVEMDLGTESVRIWRRKTQTYVSLALSGAFAARFHQPHFRVLVVVPSERRLHTVRRVVRALTTKIFWFATLESIHRDSFFASLWLRPRGDERLPLIQETR